MWEALPEEVKAAYFEGAAALGLDLAMGLPKGIKLCNYMCDAWNKILGRDEDLFEPAPRHSGVMYENALPRIGGEEGLVAIIDDILEN